MLVSSMLVGLREGMESCIVISILTAFLTQSDRRGWIPLVRIGLGCSLVLAVVGGGLLTYSRAILGPFGQGIFEAVTSVVAAAFISGMIFWMRHPPQSAEEELRGRLSKVLRLGPFTALTISFFAVLREGIEATTVVFVTGQQVGTGPVRPLVSLLVGIAGAILLSWLLYRGAIRINMATFFTVTGFLLIFVGAGVVSEGLRALQDAGVLPGAHDFAFDISSALPANAWWVALLMGIVNISTRPTVLQAVAWATYWAVVTAFFLRALRHPRPAPAPRQPELVRSEPN